MIGLQEKSLIADLGEINPQIHQPSAYHHGSAGSAAVLEDTRIMDDPHVQRLRHLPVQPVTADQKRNQFGSRTGLRLDLIDHAKALVGNMMIDHDGLLCRVEIILRRTKPLQIRAVNRKEHIMRRHGRIVMYNLVGTGDKPE